MELDRMGDEVVDIGSRRQLLVDDYLIEDIKSLKRSFHVAVKHQEPVMVPEHPWEGVGTAPWPSVFTFGDVMWDEERGVYRMWYTTATADVEGQHTTLYATSRDGINWEKPLDLGITEYNGNKENNILISNCTPENVLKIEDEPDPDKRYQMFTYDRNVDAYAWRYSADGVNWGEPVQVPALEGMFDIGNVAYDPVIKMYVLAVKEGHSSDYVHPILGKHPNINFRHWLFATSPDGLDWTDPIDMLGDFDDIDRILYMEGEGCSMLNTYGISLNPYHGVYLGIQWMFRITDPAGFWNCHGGPMDGRLLISREWGGPWKIPSREFILPRGEKGEWDWGMICGVSNRPVPSPDGREWWYYYGGWTHGHGISERRACIGLAKFRVDGFASIDSLDTEGSLTTRLLTFAGNKLLLNVDASGEDSIGNENYAIVELLNSRGEVIEGYSRDSCDEISTDEVNHEVTWGGVSDISELKGWEIRVRIFLRGAELYAIQFTYA